MHTVRCIKQVANLPTIALPLNDGQLFQSTLLGSSPGAPVTLGITCTRQEGLVFSANREFGVRLKYGANGAIDLYPGAGMCRIIPARDVTDVLVWDLGSGGDVTVWVDDLSTLDTTENT